MSDNLQLRWQEPWFFSLRMRDRRGWRRKGWLIGVIFVAMMVGWYLDQHYGKGLRIGLIGAIFLDLGIAVFVGFLPDLGLSQVQVTDTGIVRAFYGHGVGADVWRYEDILTFSFVPPGSSARPFGLLVLVTRTGIVTLGVPTRVSTGELVELFRCRGIQQAPTPVKAPPRTGSTVCVL